MYDRYARAVFRYAAGRVGNGHADDIMSETFLVAFERRESFDITIGDARPWLFGIATTLMRKHSRVEAKAWKGLVAHGAAAVPDDAIEAIGSRIDAEFAVKAIAAALRKMPTRDRDALLLYAWADLDYEGVAQALQIPVGTVRSRLNRARRTLRAASHRGSTPDQEVEHGRNNVAAETA
ncbi:sigma-70 family RNA polymerase sigma factor [Cryobacterium tagatosivorans]|uniref:Sigma-70 family RNA polymerase sigma factor n=1 Tax=Cryobacterium tagatosivorans TaxID=1259199 RepID=A0A4R8UHQ4_9MICO|nr:sigma-70 family RNA polymerase sigma factor [Cryobacterium tagatosivorans]